MKVRVSDFLGALVGSAPLASSAAHLVTVGFNLQTFDILVFSIFLGLWICFSSASYCVLVGSAAKQLKQDDQFSPKFRLWLVALWLLSGLTQGYVLSTINLFSLGDGEAHRTILNALQLPGPKSLNPFDHLGLAGPPYPQAFHFLVIVFSTVFGIDDLSTMTLVVVGVYGSYFLPIVLRSYAQARFGQSLPAPEILTISIVFASALSYDVSLGGFPAMLAVPSSLFVATLVQKSGLTWRKILVVLCGSFLLLNVHPTGLASLLFLITWKRSRDFLIAAVLLAITVVFLSENLPHANSLLSQWSTSQINHRFTWNYWSIPLDIGQTVRRLLLLEGSSIGLNLIAGMMGWYALCSSRRTQHPDGIKIAVTTSLLLTTYLSGIPGTFGQIAGFPTLLWYSTPVRFIHVQIVLLFILVVKLMLVDTSVPGNSKFAQCDLVRNQRNVTLLLSFIFLAWTMSTVTLWVSPPSR